MPRRSQTGCRREEADRWAGWRAAGRGLTDERLWLFAEKCNHDRWLTYSVLRSNINNGNNNNSTKPQTFFRAAAACGCNCSASSSALLLPVWQPFMLCSGSGHDHSLGDQTQGTGRGRMQLWPSCGCLISSEKS